MLLERGAKDMEALAEARLPRSIGVVYQLETERAIISKRTCRSNSNALIHIDEPRALESLE